MSVKTQYEIDAKWSSVDFGVNFMQVISEETNAILSVYGKTVEGRDLYALRVGNGNRKIIATSGVHGTEPASREAFLMKTRDICYNENGEYTDFLNQHDIILIPTINPDMMHKTYRNAENIDINRVIYHLDSPEGVSFLKLVRDFNPSVHLDLHEHSSFTEGDVRYVRPMHLDPNSDVYLRQLQMEVIDFLKVEMGSEGYSADYYFDNNTGFGSLTSGMGILGKLAFTTETHIRNSDLDYRLNAQKSSFDKSLYWVKDNWSKIENMNTVFEKNLPKEDSYFTLLQGMNPGAEMYTQATHEIIKLPYGYKPIDDFSEFIDVYNLKIDENGVIPVNQLAGRMLPHLLDPRADTKVVKAELVYKGEEEERKKGGRYTKVKYDEWREVFIKYM